jgi:hypothetical protein
LVLIEIRIGDHVLLRTGDSCIEQIAVLNVATVRRFREGRGFAVTFVGFQNDVDRMPAGHTTVWFHPSMPVTFDYGTGYDPVQVDEVQIARALEEMDASELGVVVARARVPVAFN